jgi:ADP-L-glycero-D-manno-heptose 6-epimerase
MLDNNYTYSRVVLDYCLARGIPFVYASSAAVYGKSLVFRVEQDFEHPLNVYAYSKLLFDQYVRRRLPQAKSQIVGLRYFNVYGPRENHKGKMASIAYHLNAQILNDGKARLFEGHDGYANGEQRRDFIHVDDVCAVNLWFLEHAKESGLFNLGTGRSHTFNDVANAVIGWHGAGEIEYIPFPEHLKGHYQSSTEADMEYLRDAGYRSAFMPVETGIPAYLDWLNR